MPQIKKIRAVEYNFLMSMLKLLTDRVPDIMKEYGYYQNINILPAYPRDLTKLSMPSIIVRKVEGNESKVAIDNFIGQIYDKKENKLSDVKAVRHDITCQFDILASGNANTNIIASIIEEGLFNEILVNESGYIPFYDFIGKNRDNPVNTGTLCMIGLPKEVNLSSLRISVQEPTINEHALLLRQRLALIQTIIPNQDYVDLSLWIKQHIKLKIKEE